MDFELSYSYDVKLNIDIDNMTATIVTTISGAIFRAEMPFKDGLLLSYEILEAEQRS